MSRRGMAVLTLSAIGFLVAIILLYQRGPTIMPGLQSEYFGQNQIEVYNAYITIEKELLYVDLTAEYAFESAGGVIDTERQETSCSAIDADCEEEDSPNYISNTQEFMAKFAHEFDLYLEEYDMGINASDYVFTLDSNGLKGICSRELTMTVTIEDTDLLEYKTKPNFRIITNTGLNGESTYSGEELMKLEPASTEEVPAEEINTGDENNPCVSAGGKCRMGCIIATEVPFEGKTCPQAWSHDQICCKSNEEATAETPTEEPIELGAE